LYRLEVLAEGYIARSPRKLFTTFADVRFACLSHAPHLSIDLVSLRRT
jgi:hypothetical protein